MRQSWGPWEGAKLLGGTTEKSVSSLRSHWFALQAISFSPICAPPPSNTTPPWRLCMNEERGGWLGNKILNALSEALIHFLGGYHFVTKLWYERTWEERGYPAKRSLEYKRCISSPREITVLHHGKFSCKGKWLLSFFRRKSEVAFSTLFCSLGRYKFVKK